MVTPAHLPALRITDSYCLPASPGTCVPGAYPDPDGSDGSL